MKHNNAAILTIASLGFGLILIGPVTPANAIVITHSGMPTSIKGWWRTKMKKISLGHGKHLWTYETIHITKNRIRGSFGTQSDHYAVHHLEYMPMVDIHPIEYQVRGEYEVYKHSSYIYDFQKINKKHLLIGERDLKSLELKTNTITNFYKFSGKASKKTFYPYN